MFVSGTEATDLMNGLIFHTLVTGFSYSCVMCVIKSMPSQCDISCVKRNQGWAVVNHGLVQCFLYLTIIDSGYGIKSDECFVLSYFGSRIFM